MLLLVEIFYVYEDLKNDIRDIRNSRLFRIRLNSLDSLIRLDERKHSSYLKELRLEKMGLENPEEIIDAVHRHILMIGNCDSILMKANQDVEAEKWDDAISKYFNILVNRDFDLMVKHLMSIDSLNNTSDKDCFDIKDVAFYRLVELMDKKKTYYKSTLKKADSLFIKGDCNRASEYYALANDINRRLSLYPSYMIEKCTGIKVLDAENYTLDTEIIVNDSTAKDTLVDFVGNRKSYSVVSDITSIISKSFKIPENKSNIANQNIEHYIDTNMVSITIDPRENSVFGWIYEMNYDSGRYKSSYEERISARIVEAVVESYLAHSEDIYSITISNFGFADVIGFGNNKLKFPNKEYAQIEGKVCDCSNDDCFEFQNLIKGKSKNSNDSDYQKNLALAFLRAHHRKVLIRQKIGNKIPKKLLEYVNCGQVSNKEGNDQRKVVTEISIFLND